jgi:predicted RNA-binding Zn-ribbon protein involved in translation (DUF1610 family)
MSSQMPESSPQPHPDSDQKTLPTEVHALAHGEMLCPVCGDAMPDLKGGKATICPNCGFKDSCCY